VGELTGWPARAMSLILQPGSYFEHRTQGVHTMDPRGEGLVPSGARKSRLQFETYCCGLVGYSPGCLHSVFVVRHLLYGKISLTISK